LHKPFQAYSEKMIWYLLIAFTGAAWILLLGDVVWSLLRKPPRSPVQRLRMFGRLLLPLSGLILAVNLFGLQAGWPHDGAEPTLKWTSFALVTVNLVWSFGQNRLIAVLAARAAARQGQSE
jgi:hypothetical protein